jgi:beta-carotene 15,15'-dioxygenase
LTKALEALLLAFIIYFCATHSPRHVLRTPDVSPDGQARPALALALWPTLAVLVSAAALLFLAADVPVEARVMQIAFVGLAALTLPHMLIEWARRKELTAAR